MSTITPPGTDSPEGADLAAAGPSGAGAAGDPAPPAPGVSAGAPPPGERVLQVPRDTTPTWELEMLVSGAVLFGLFQLPPLLDSAWHSVLPRVPTHFAQLAVWLLLAYVRGMAYALTGAFVVHLASRAYWVALVGLDSVFPGGIRWEGTHRYGPISGEVIRAQVPTLPALISRVDNFCSTIFAVGFATVSLVLTALITLAAAVVLAWGVSTWVLGANRAESIFPLAILFLVVPVMALRLDRRFGARLPPHGLAARAIRSAARLNQRIFGLAVHGPLYLTLVTNIRRGRGVALLLALMAVSVGVAWFETWPSRGQGVVPVFAGLPDGLQADASQYRTYADQRTGDAAYAGVPFIQSDIVRDPFVRLFVPYVPQRDAQALAACRHASARPAVGTPGGAPGAAPSDAQVAVSCLAAIDSITLNGRPLTGVDLRFATDPGSGYQGLLVYIPAAALPRGHNIITVRRLPPADAEAGERPPAPFIIPFWL